MKKAVIMFSGGLDSTTVLAYAKNQGFECYPITFHYGQKHDVEARAAERICKYFEIKNHKIAVLPSDLFGASALTSESIEVPEYQGTGTIPVTYVPARNTIFLSIALGYAESIGADDIFLGISEVDYSGYPDCRPEYIAAFQNLANLATKKAVEGTPMQIHSPLLSKSKADTIRMGLSLGVDYGLTVSCYSATPETGAACGGCDSCTYRKKGFHEAGVSDPTLYKEKS